MSGEHNFITREAEEDLSGPISEELLDKLFKEPYQKNIPDINDLKDFITIACTGKNINIAVAITMIAELKSLWDAVEIQPSIEEKGWLITCINNLADINNPSEYEGIRTLSGLMLDLILDTYSPYDANTIIINWCYDLNGKLQDSHPIKDRLKKFFNPLPQYNSSSTAIPAIEVDPNLYPGLTAGQYVHPNHPTDSSSPATTSLNTQQDVINSYSFALPTSSAAVATQVYVKGCAVCDHNLSQQTTSSAHSTEQTIAINGKHTLHDSTNTTKSKRPKFPNTLTKTDTISPMKPGSPIIID